MTGCLRPATSNTKRLGRIPQNTTDREKYYLTGLEAGSTLMISLVLVHATSHYSFCAINTIDSFLY